MEETKQETTKTNDRYDTVLSFLSIELLALVCFGLGGATGMSIFKVLGLFIGVMIFPYAKNVIGENGKKKLLISLIPEIVLLVLLTFSRFWLSAYYDLMSSLVEGVIFLVAMTGIYLVGFSVKYIKSLKQDYVFLGIGIGLGALTLTVTLYTMIRYGFFYALIYRNMDYYFEGAVFHVFTEMKFLNGFAFDEVVLGYGSIPAFILSSVLPACLFVSPKKSKITFYSILGFGLLGLVSLIVIPSTTALFLLIPVYLVALVIYLFRKSVVAPSFHKGEKIAYFALIGIVGLGFALIILDSYLGIEGSFLSKIPLVGRLFAYEYGASSDSIPYFGQIEKSIRILLFGADAETRASLNIMNILLGTKLSLDGGIGLTQVSTQSLAFNVLSESGIVALILYIFVLFKSVKMARQQMAKKEEPMYRSVIVAMLVLSISIYLNFIDIQFPYVHKTNLAEIATRGQYMMLFVFLLGYMNSPEEEIHE